MIERQIDIATKDGPMATFITHPERGGPHPVILFFMDAPGIREELRDMARRFASVGYYVMLPNLYYRDGVMEIGAFIGDAATATREKMFKLMGNVTIPNVMEDADALVAFADKETAASDGPMSAVGYCMSGQYALSAAARYPRRIAGAASIYGVRLMTDKPDSPHLAVRESLAEFYIACAEIDHYVPLDTVAPLREDLAKHGVKAEVELYPKVEHGFAFPQRPAFDRDAAERHWERLFALFGRTLTPAAGPR